MANKLNPSFPMPAPFNLTDFGNISDYLTFLLQSLQGLEREQTLVINAIIDEVKTPMGPTGLKSYLKTALPSAALYANAMIFVSNDVGGSTPAFSDGTNWRRVADRAIIS